MATKKGLMGDAVEGGKIPKIKHGAESPKPLKKVKKPAKKIK